MAYPTATDSFTAPASGDYLNSPAHSVQHSGEQTAVVAVQTKIGTGASTPVASTYLKGTGTGTSAWTVLTINRAFTWYLDGTSIVADEVGAKYIAPQNLTVVSIKAKTVSGTATIRLQKGTTDIDASISVTSSVATETSITSAAITADDVITLDITAASSCVGLSVTVECTQP